MAKKRNCRRNPQERADHERAVALRKMPDSQLVAHFDRQYKAGLDAGRIEIERAKEEAAGKILEAIGAIKGIGAATLAKIQEALDESANHA